MRLHIPVAGRILTIAALLAATISCGDVARQGRSPVYVVIDSLLAAPGGGFGANQFTGTLRSDVIVLLRTPDPCSPASPCPTFYSDSGQVTLHLQSKELAIAPTSNNQVTLRRYRVTYRRVDGRNTPGVDVPFGFDGAFTGTIPPTGQATFSFELVRHIAKQESPLIQLRSNPNILLTMADVTIYGTDLVGNEVSVTGSITIEFGNFGDA